MNNQDKYVEYNPFKQKDSIKRIAKTWGKPMAEAVEKAKKIGIKYWSNSRKWHSFTTEKFVLKEGGVEVDVVLPQFVTRCYEVSVYAAWGDSGEIIYQDKAIHI